MKINTRFSRIYFALRSACTIFAARTNIKQMKIGIIVAMDKELVQLKALLDDATVERRNNKDFILGSIDGKDVVLQKCGIGKVNSAVGAVELIDNYAPDVVISTGVAGGADDRMSVGDVVIGSEYCYHDAYCGDECAFGQIMGMPESFAAPAGLVGKAVSACEGKAAFTGLIASGDWFVDTQNKMRAIVARFPKAVAVDMESCSIAQVCHVYGVPFISFRIISDIPLKDNKASQYFDFWARMAEGSFTVTKRLIAAL